MASSLCKTSVQKTYQDVINDVILNAREHFLEDGVDEAVLLELKQLWETKLAATKAVEESDAAEKTMTVNNRPAHKQDYGPINMSKHVPQMLPPNIQMIRPPQQLVPPNKQMFKQMPPTYIPPAHITDSFLPEWRRVPIQLTIPSAPGIGDGNRILSIDVPEIFLQGYHLKSILTGQVISTTMGLPLMTACTFLQEQVNQAFIKYQQQFFSMNNINPVMLQHNENMPSTHAHPNAPQRDGPADSSEEEDEEKSEEDGSDSDLHDDKDDDLQPESPQGTEDKPLNSEDDVSDDDNSEELFEADNVIVCQYDKVTRSRNRWKFHLKDGIMNLNGEDFVFQKANGDAEW